MIGSAERGCNMPTDLEALFVRKRKAQKQKKKQRQTNITMLSLWVVVCLVMLMLVFVDKGYARAMAELMDLF
jgi:hypothetical protein